MDGFSSNQRGIDNLLLKASCRLLAQDSLVNPPQLNRSTPISRTLNLWNRKNTSVAQVFEKLDGQVIMDKKGAGITSNCDFNDWHSSQLSLKNSPHPDLRRKPEIKSNDKTFGDELTMSDKNTAIYSQSKIVNSISSTEHIPLVDPKASEYNQIDVTKKYSTQTRLTDKPWMRPSTSLPQQADKLLSFHNSKILDFRNDSSKLLSKDTRCAVESTAEPVNNNNLKFRKKNKLDSLAVIGVEKKYLKKPPRLKSKIVKIKYNNLIEAEVAQILNTPFPYQLKSSQISSFPSHTNTATTMENSQRSIHPLFLGKLVKTTADAKILSKKCIDSSPFRKHSKKSLENTSETHIQEGKSSKSPSSKKSTPKPYFTGIETTKKKKSFLKALEPAWPWKGMVHVRGIDYAKESLDNGSKIEITPSFSIKRLKQRAIEIDPSEDIIVAISDGLTVGSVIKDIQNLNTDEFPSIPKCLRVPAKLHESGIYIQHQVRKQTRCRLNILNSGNMSSSEDEIQGSGTKLNCQLHPALTKVYSSVSSSLSAFDEGKCESYTWAQKYAPLKAEEVLQPGPEALILKDWLSNLTTDSVETGSKNFQKLQNAKIEPSCKRKRRCVKLDGFIVSDEDEESVDLEEIYESEEDTTRRNQYQIKRTLVRGGEWPKKSNIGSKTHRTILISGPNGCGKSAAVYAAAKELHFEVFEINSSSRRSGRDILEKIGDMMMNHHVHKINSLSQSDDTEQNQSKIKVPKTNRKGTINSFLRSSSKKVDSNNISSIRQPPGVTKTQSENCKNVSKVKLATGALSNDQKQSLILIEEADIIFKEDVQFWSTIENIITISRRPIILTCNDESAIPLSPNYLYAILRFQPPPIDLAVDYMLMVAACEGHLIQREAIETLYEERQLDLRASISELNFWCQFAVGDSSRGLSWYPSQRHLKLDADKLSDRVRVISEGTYKRGMGWISRDILAGNLSHLDIEDEILFHTSNYWNLDIGDWEMSHILEKWSEKSRRLGQSKDKQLVTLNMIIDYTASMSDSDLVSNSLFGSENKLKIDHCSPKICKKALEEFPLAYKTIEVTPSTFYPYTAPSISLSLRSRARDLLRVKQKQKDLLEIPLELLPFTESRIIDLIRQKCKFPTKILHRIDFSQAFDPISYPATHNSMTPTASGFFEASQFDRTQTIISEDLAPYVRLIVANDTRLQRGREKMSRITSESSVSNLRGKKRRTTRAAMCALEGGIRNETRPEKYFGDVLNPILVEKTGVPHWMKALERSQQKEEKTMSIK